MKVDQPLVDKLATLARLSFQDKEKEAIIRDLDHILHFVEKLEELDTSGIKPLVYVTEEHNVFREDEVHMDLSKEDALKNAPLKDSDYIKVPKVIKRED